MGALVLVATGPAGAALAQVGRYAPTPSLTTETAGYYLIPSATLAEVFDSNIFLNADPQWDFITRLTTGFQAGFRSVPFTILGNYSFDTEVYARNPSLDNVGQNQRGSFDLRYLPERHTTLGLDAVFARTNNPVLLSQQVGLQPVAQIQPGRQESIGFTITPSISHQFSPLWTGTAAYSYSVYSGQDIDTTTTNVLALGLTRLFSPADTGALNYYFRTYDSRLAFVMANVFTLGWTHRFSEFTTVTARAGPRFSQGQVGPEIFASVQHRMKFVDLSLTYVDTQAVDLGASEPVTTRSVAAAATFQLARYLRVSVGPSFQISSGEANSNIGTTYYYAVSAVATYQINKWLSAIASYSWSLQTGFGGDIPHNLVALGLTVTYPMRVD